ncbi:hypothetical protein GQ43DRAFT_431501 [Delitschia confertaspora ATCC 74209]|uniref:Uncharacterized protein n=1 Tax=Delitschia confertaspora ATCC 74209 TaxID=1513339 RepID=A0A9P4JQW1_9PLEO|nr:hypothetical protein GQ43DRAFT_431501 [Delitschia confertaspora ATCC 74209]
MAKLEFVGLPSAGKSALMCSAMCTGSWGTQKTGCAAEFSNYIGGEFSINGGAHGLDTVNRHMDIQQPHLSKFLAICGLGVSRIKVFAVRISCPEVWMVEFLQPAVSNLSQPLSLTGTPPFGNEVHLVTFFTESDNPALDLSNALHEHI